MGERDTGSGRIEHFKIEEEVELVKQGWEQLNEIPRYIENLQLSKEHFEDVLLSLAEGTPDYIQTQETIVQLGDQTVFLTDQLDIWRKTYASYNPKVRQQVEHTYGPKPEDMPN